MRRPRWVSWLLEHGADPLETGARGDMVGCVLVEVVREDKVADLVQFLRYVCPRRPEVVQDTFDLLQMASPSATRLLFHHGFRTTRPNERVQALDRARDKCKHTALLVMALRRRSAVLRLVDHNVARMLAQGVWSTRRAVEWEKKYQTSA